MATRAAAPAVRRLAEEPVGALPGVDAGGVVFQPPTRHAEALERVGRLRSFEGALEADAGLFPGPAGEGVAAGLEAVGRGGVEGGGRTDLGVG